MDLSVCEKKVVAAISAVAKTDPTDEAGLVSRLADLASTIKLLVNTATSIIERGFRDPKDAQDLSVHTDALLSYLRETVTELKPLFADPSGRDQLRGRMVPMLKRIAILSKAVITCVHHKVEGAPDGVTNTKVGCVACSGCSSALDETEGHIHYDGRCFHVACMRCASCQATVTAQRFALDNDGRPLCEACSPRCHGCRQPVLGDGLAAFDRWYHAPCFRCTHCRRVIGNVSRFYQKNSEPYCSVCISRDSVLFKRDLPDLSKLMSATNADADALLAAATGSARTSMVAAHQQSPSAVSAPVPIPPGSQPRQPAIASSSASTISVAISTAPATPASVPTSDTATPAAAAALGIESMSMDESAAQSDFALSAAKAVPRPLENRSRIEQRRVTVADSTTSIQSSQDSIMSDGSSLLTTSSASQPPVDVRSLDGVLATDTGVDYLVSFCVEDYSIEKLFFWLDIRQFRGIKVPLVDLTTYANSIFHKYMRPGAELEIDVPAPLKAGMEARLKAKDIDSSMYNQAQALIYQQLLDDVFPKFFYSEIGQKYLQVVGAAPTRTIKIQANHSRDRAATKPTPAADMDEPLDRITDVSIVNFEKRYEPEKYYVYELRVQRGPRAGETEPVEEPIHVYRRYSQFFQLHQSLQRQFPEAPFPPFPPKIYLGRSQTQKVSRQRQENLNLYIKGLLQHEQVARSGHVMEFLKPAEEDISNYWFNKRLSAASHSFSHKYH